MFGLVISDNMLVLYVFWELTTVLSFLLVGHYAERVTSRRAAVQALLVTTAGGLAMLIGIVVLGNDLGHLLLSELIAAPPSGLRLRSPSCSFSLAPCPNQRSFRCTSGFPVRWPHRHR